MLYPDTLRVASRTSLMPELVPEKALANTYSPEHLENGWAAVERYRKWEAWETDHSDVGRADAERSLGIPRRTIDAWRGGSAPRAVKALQTAQEHGWLSGTTHNEIGEGLARLLAWVYATGSLAEGPRGQLELKFTVRNEGDQERLERWAAKANVEIRYDFADNEQKVTLGRVDTHPQLFARVLMAMGAHVGRQSERAAVPSAISDSPSSPVARAFVATYLRNKGSMHPQWDKRFVIREDRPEAFLVELAEVLEEVLETEVHRSRKFISIQPREVRGFLDRVDDVESDIDW